MEIPSSVICHAHSLYDEGLYLQAYRHLETFGAPEEWSGTEALLLGGRLIQHLGAHRRARVLFLRAYRADRHNLEARYYYIHHVLERHGPLAAWKLLQKPVDLTTADSDRQSAWFALHARIAGMFRDFDVAETWLARAEEVSPCNPWVYVERSSLLAYQDRYPEALEAAEQALQYRPNYRAGVQSAAEILQIVGREQEALALLYRMSATLECAFLTAQLFALQTEREQYAEAQHSLERFVALSPLAEQPILIWIAAMRSELAYFLGDNEQSIRFARDTKTPYFLKMADYLEKAEPTARRVQLPVIFVRQHHLTCAPATLAALSNFWKMSADHLEIADAICYDGTPWHSQRDWAEKNGWQTRELTVTWESAITLLDRGIPFTLSTEGPGFAHLQAVVGYDSRRGTLLIRDPYNPHIEEPLGREFLRDLRPYGPRGMAMVPTSQADLLDGIDFADSALYDLSYQIQCALTIHQRDKAQTTYETLCRTAPDHPITLRAGRALAAYDSDLSKSLTCIEALHTLFPDEPNLILARLSCLRMLTRREERLKLLEALCEHPVRNKRSEARPDADEGENTVRTMTPMFLQEYAEELSDDARRHSKAINLLYRAIRRSPSQGENLYTLANILWSRQEFAEAAQLYRFAACLEPYNEQYARSYFIASRWMKQTDRVLDFLLSRYRRLGSKSNLPARTLFQALEQLDRISEAFALLKDALHRRPEDGDLRLFTAHALARYGQFEQANRLLAEAEGKTADIARLRTAANLAGLQNDAPKALALWQQIAAANPLAMDAQGEIAQLLAQLHGPEAAARHYEALSEMFPHHFDLHCAWATWLRQQEFASTRERVLKHICDINPVSAWARRELALCLAHQQRFEEAKEEARTAQELEPVKAASHIVWGDVYAMAGEWPEARKSFRRALELTVDNGYAMSRLVDACDTAQERCEVMRFVGEQLAQQTIFGDGLLAFRQYAHNTLPPAEIHSRLQQALTARPDLWKAWSAMIDQLSDMDRLEEAARLAEQATARFPLQPTLWLDLASIRAVKGDYAGEKAALEQALQVAPGYGQALRQLAQSWDRTGQIDRAKAVMETAVAWDALDPANHASLAYILWENGEKEATIERLNILLRLDPDNAWGWNTLRVSCEALGRSQEAVQAVRDLTIQRPGEVRSWLMLARALQADTDLPERLQALERAVTLNARCYEAYDLKAEILSNAGRYAEAEQACKLPDGQKQPTLLRVRLACIASERGEKPEALRLMRAALAEDPSYHAGWQILSRWYRNDDDHTGYLEAAQQLTRLEPQDAPSWGYLGDAKMRKGDRLGAKTAWKRAVEISPDYRYAAEALFAAQIADKELPQAGQTVALTLPYRREGWPLTMAVTLAAKRQDSRAACDVLRELCVSQEDVEDELTAAADVMRENGMDQQAHTLYEALLTDPNIQPVVGALWVEGCARRKDWRCESQILALKTNGEIGLRAANAWINALADAGKKRDLILFIEKHHQWLTQNDTSWGAVSYVLLKVREYRETVRWTDDWQKRSKAEAWMLLNRVIALRNLKLPERAAQVSQYALTLPTTQYTSRHALWLTVDVGLAGKTEEAAKLLQHLRGVDATSLPPYYQFLHGLAQALATPTSADSGRNFVEVRSYIRQARHAYKTYLYTPVLIALFQRTIWRVAQNRGSIPAYLWAILEMRFVLESIYRRNYVR